MIGEAVASVRGAVPQPRGDAAAALAGALVLAAAFAFSLSRQPPPFGLELAAGAAFLAVVALAVVHVDAAVTLGFLLAGVALVEPAPADFVFLVVVAVVLATGRFRTSAPPVAVAALGAFLALNFLSAIEVVDGHAAALYLGITVYLTIFAFWLAGFVDSRRRARLVAAGYLGAAAASAALGAAALLMPLPGSESFVGAGRVHALFQDPNVFGAFMVPIALILLEDFLTPRLFNLRPAVKASLLGLLVLGIVLSFSRGAWINLLLGTIVLLGVLGLRRGGGRKVLRVALLAILLTGLVATILAATGSQSFLLERVGIHDYDAGRFAGQAAGIESSERYPLGLGPGQFEAYASISAHSTYVRAFAEQGVAGLIVFVAFAVSTLAAAVANAFAGRETYGIGSAALLGAFCGMLVNGIVIDTLHWRHFWIVIALIWAGWARRRLRRRPANAHVAVV
jgi:O-antigen ligase